MTTKHSSKKSDKAARQSSLPALNLEAIEAARDDINEGAITQSSSPYRESIIGLLNDALATELVCVLRYRRHHFTAKGMISSEIAKEFLVHANEELVHADKLAQRIVQLSGEPDFSPSSLTKRSHADYDESDNIKDMIKSNLISERIAIESYRQMIERIGEKDPTTRRILEEILSDEEEHADELSSWLNQ